MQLTVPLNAPQSKHSSAVNHTVTAGLGETQLCPFLGVLGQGSSRKLPIPNLWNEPLDGTGQAGAAAENQGGCAVCRLWKELFAAGSEPNPAEIPIPCPDPSRRQRWLCRKEVTLLGKQHLLRLTFPFGFLFKFLFPVLTAPPQVDISIWISV